MAATPAGVVLAVRHVCPDGAAWGAAGTGWEVVRVDLADPAAAPVTILSGPSLPPAADGFERTGDVLDVLVAPDGSTFAVARMDSVDQFHWTAYSLDAAPIELPLPGGCAKGPGPDDLELLGEGRAVLARWCRVAEGAAELRIEVVDLTTGLIGSSVSVAELDDTPPSFVELDIDDRGAADPWILARWSAVGTPEGAVVHGGSASPIPAAGPSTPR